MADRPTMTVVGHEGLWELLCRPWHVRCSECRTVGRHRLLSAAQAQADAHHRAHALIAYAETHAAMRGVLLPDPTEEHRP